MDASENPESQKERKNDKNPLQTVEIRQAKTLDHHSNRNCWCSCQLTAYFGAPAGLSQLRELPLKQCKNAAGLWADRLSLFAL